MTSCVTSRQVKASLRHPAISPDQGASKIVKISQQMSKIKVACFFLGHGVVHYCSAVGCQIRHTRMLGLFFHFPNDTDRIVFVVSKMT